jgi:hypothetical protein
MWSSSRPLSESSEWQRSSVTSPLTDSLQTSSMYGSFDSSPGEVSSAHRLQLVSLPLDSRPRQGLKQSSLDLWLEPTCEVLAFVALMLSLPPVALLLCFRTPAQLPCFLVSRCCYCISIYSRRCLGRRSLRRTVGLRFCFGWYSTWFCFGREVSVSYWVFGIFFLRLDNGDRCLLLARSGSRDRVPVRTTHENMNALAIWPDRRRVSALAKVVRAMILCTVHLV